MRGPRRRTAVPRRRLRVPNRPRSASSRRNGPARPLSRRGGLLSRVRAHSSSRSRQREQARFARTRPSTSDNDLGACLDGAAPAASLPGCRRTPCRARRGGPDFGDAVHLRPVGARGSLRPVRGPGVGTPRGDPVRTGQLPHPPGNAPQPRPCGRSCAGGRRRGRALHGRAGAHRRPGHRLRHLGGATGPEPPAPQGTRTRRHGRTSRGPTSSTSARSAMGCSTPSCVTGARSAT